MLSDTVSARAADLAGVLARLRNRLERTPQLPDLQLAAALVLIDKATGRVEKCLAELDQAANQLPFDRASTPPPAAPSTGPTASNGTVRRPGKERP